MKLNQSNKRIAGIKESNERLGEPFIPWREFPDYMEEYIAKLPPSHVNNSKKIVRADFRRIMKLGPITASKILAEKYQMYPDLDREAKDYGGPPNEELPF